MLILLVRYFHLAVSFDGARVSTNSCTTVMAAEIRSWYFPYPALDSLEEFYMFAEDELAQIRTIVQILARQTQESTEALVLEVRQLKELVMERNQIPVPRPETRVANPRVRQGLTSQRKRAIKLGNSIDYQLFIKF